MTTAAAPSPPSNPAGGALHGIRILDFTWVGAGSLTTRFFAEHGAEVIKIESSTHLDSLRIGPPFAGGVKGVNRSGYFAQRNANKDSVTINMRDPRGIALVHRMVPHCDVVANNFRPGVMDRLGMGYPTVRELKENIVYLAMSMQGDQGPERDYLGYGVTISALAGLTYLTADPDRYPAGTGTHYPDHVPNPAHAAFALLAALRHRRRTGEGQYIELAQTEPTIATLGPEILRASISDSPPEPLGNRHPTWAPHGVYPCAGEDRWIAIAVRSDTEWQAAAQALGITDPAGRWQRASERNDPELGRLIESATRPRQPYELMHALQAAGVAAGVVQNARDLVVEDPQLRHRGHWQYLNHTEVGRTLYGRSPFRLRGNPGVLDRAAPCLGEHTDSVLNRLLQLEAHEIDELRSQGVLQ